LRIVFDAPTERVELFFTHMMQTDGTAPTDALVV
jgi:hypothetical protein